jgi:glutamate formiminotransferase
MYIECIPNFSEGKNKKVIESFAQVISSSGNFILDKESDENHNRSVITVVGNKETLIQGMFNAIELASKLIDLNFHKGEHPRIGAVDVVPFVPLKGASMQDCIDLAINLGKKVGDEISIPVYLYGEAARKPDRKDLANIRRGQFEALKEELGKNPERIPDFGPNKIHSTAGAIAIGARFFLIAYNINLSTSDINIAKEIAKRIRTSSGGLPHVKAIGVELKSRGIVQVSMNLTDYRVTPIIKVYEEVEKLTKLYNTSIIESEIIGLIPQEAIDKNVIDRIKLKNFSEEQIIENKLKQLGI